MKKFSIDNYVNMENEKEQKKSRKFWRLKN